MAIVWPCGILVTEVMARRKKTLERGIGLSPKRSTSKALSRSKTKIRSNGLLAEVRDLILEARQQTARMVNAGLTLLYWQVGDRIQREILQEKRAEYGAEIVLTLSAHLELEFGRGFGEKNLRRMVQLAEVFPGS